VSASASSAKSNKVHNRVGSAVHSKNGKVDERNIGDILNNVWKEYNKWKNEGNTGEFIYEINP
jgi:hypothetical protein